MGETKAKRNLLKTQKAITLIALIVTIIVLLILAGVSIATLTGENGVLTRASDAKIETVVAAVKENLHLEQIEKTMDEEELTAETLLAEGKVKRTVQKAEDENYYMYYALKEDAVEGMQGLGKGNVASLRDVFLIDDDLNVKYIAKNGKEYGDNIEDKILEDETEIRFSSKAFSEYISKISGVTEDEMKFKWMKNQTSLTIADVNITSLEDLVFFPNLLELQIGSWDTVMYPNTGIMNMDNLGGIENCTKLEKIAFIRLRINDISEVGSCLNLKSFSASSGKIESLVGLGECLNLKELDINSIEINKSDFLKEFKDLENIEILTYGNNINNWLVGMSELVNCKSANKITYLNLNTNKISDLKGIESFPNLTSLDLSNNDIEDITPIASIEKLNQLNLSKNPKINGNRSYYENNGTIDKIDKIGEILDREGNIILDSDKLGLFNNYKTMSLRNQGLENLDILEGMTQITRLDLYGNDIRLEDDKSKEILKNMTNLQFISFMNNKNLKDISVLNEIPTLTELMLQYTNVNLSQIEDIISNLNIIYLNKNVFETITDCNPTKITKLKVSLTESEKIEKFPDISKFSKLSELLIRNSRTDDYSCISNLVNLEKLDLQNCDLHGKMIDFSKLTKLETLNLKNNYLSSDDLKKLEVLKNNKNMIINLDNNSIIDASSLLVLDTSTRITLSGNPNLSQEDKNELVNRFGSNVTF